MEQFKNFRQGDIVEVKTQDGWKKGKVQRIRKPSMGDPYMKVSMDDATVATLTSSENVRFLIEEDQDDKWYETQMGFNILTAIVLAVVSVTALILLILTL